MGQSTSDNSLPLCVGSVQEDILRHARVLTEIGTLSYEEFQSNLFKLNQVSKRCIDSEGNQLIFAVKKGSDKTLLWKGTVKIACVRMSYNTHEVVSFRLLTLTEFLKICKTLQSQFDAAEQSRESGSAIDEASKESLHCLTSLDPFDSGWIRPGSPTQSSSERQPLLLGQLSSNVTTSNINVVAEENSRENLNECCICLERRPEVLLPCAHSYCLPCIEQWNVHNKTCPICREQLESTDDTWVISEVPGAQEICGSLMELSKTARHN